MHERPVARRKPRATGLTKWALAEIAKRSPIARIELLHAARAAGYLDRDRLGCLKIKTALRRLEAKGLVRFDEITAYWMGHAAPVRTVGPIVHPRLLRITGGDREAFTRLRQNEIDRLQRQRDAALAALRPPDAPPIDPAACAPRVPRPRQRVTEGMRAILREYVAASRGRAMGGAASSGPAPHRT